MIFIAVTLKKMWSYQFTFYWPVTRTILTIRSVGSDWLLFNNTVGKHKVYSKVHMSASHDLIVSTLPDVHPSPWS